MLEIGLASIMILILKSIFKC